MTIGKKLKYQRAWLAWIPFADQSMKLQMAGFHWAWIFLILVPVIGWIALGALIVVSTWKIYEKRKYPPWLSLTQISTIVPSFEVVASIAHLVIIGFVAWKDQKGF